MKNNSKIVPPLISGFRSFWTKRKINFGKYDVVEPSKVSPTKLIPERIIKPSYSQSGEPATAPDVPEIKDEEQISKMRSSCKLAANILQAVGQYIEAGKTTDHIDTFVHNLTVESGAYPSPLNYRNFPKSVCTSVNNVACHGIPDDRPLRDGDIINVDITVFYNGYHGDCSKTFLVGNVDAMGKDLVNVTELCLQEAILQCKPGQYFRQIGATIEGRARSLGYTVIPCFIGHGIGHYFHGPPDIYHFANLDPGRMEAGMTFTIEPVLSHGGKEIEILEDGWTAVTVDNARTAQFEHTVLVTDTGVDILTVPDK